MRNFSQNPRWQRAMQKIAALRPEHRAVLQTVTADKNFADEAMRKELQSMITATGNKNRERNFGLRKKTTEARNAMAARDLSYNKGQDKKAFAIGLGNLGLSAVGSHAQRQRDDEYMDILQKLNLNYDPIVGIGNKSRWAPRKDNPPMDDNSPVGLEHNSKWRPRQNRGW